MELLIFALLVILIAGLAIYAVDLLPLDSRFQNFAKLLIIVVAIVALASRVV